MHARRFELEIVSKDTNLVPITRTCFLKCFIKTKTLETMLQERDRFIVFPVGLDDHALDLLAAHAEHPFGELRDLVARTALLTLMLPHLVEMFLCVIFSTCFFAQLLNLPTGRRSVPLQNARAYLINTLKPSSNPWS